MNHVSTPVAVGLSSVEEGVSVGRKTVVLDTSVLLSDPDSIFSFPGVDVVLPLKVIEELDNHKSRKDDVGGAARAVARALEKLRLESEDRKLEKAVPLPNDSSLRIVINGLQLDKIRAHHLDETVPDNRIIAAALGLQESLADPVEVISADVNLRLKAASLGLLASEYVQSEGRHHNEKHPGWYELNVSYSLVDELYEKHFVALSDLEESDSETLSKLKPNEFGVLRAHDAPKKTVLVRRTIGEVVDTEGAKNTVSGLALFDSKRSREAYGLKPRSKEQGFALDLLMDAKVPVVGLSGRAGTGKTILALASALQQTVERDNVYERIMILRPVVPVGNQDIGFLPGTLEEKLGPWMEAIVDAMVALHSDMTMKKAREQLDLWVESGVITLESVTYLRGRSLQKTFVLVDEAQNLEPLTLKTILTRAGAGSKVVLVGDVSQIDNPWSSERSNAISVLADRFNGKDLFGHLVLTKGERSPLADLAAELL